MRKKTEGSHIFLYFQNTRNRFEETSKEIETLSVSLQKCIAEKVKAIQHAHELEKLDEEMK